MDITALIIIPIIVGILVAIFQWLLPPREKVKVKNLLGPIIRLRRHSNLSSPTQASDEFPDASEFVRDVTIPDGTIMKPGQDFEKVWEIQNVGKVVWKNRYLRREGACDGIGLMSSPERIPIPATKPGQTVQIRVPIKAPMIPATTSSVWRMVDKQGNKCFPDRYPLSCTITVTD
jgi:hypothetical protein